MAQPSRMDAFMAGLVTYMTEDTSDSTGRTERLSSAFEGLVSIAATTTLARQQLSCRARNPRTFVVYSDGSTKGPVSGAGVAYLSLQGDGEWKGHWFGYGEAMTSVHVELAAVGQALRLARVEVEASGVEDLVVAVVCDCTSALDWIVKLEEHATLGLAPPERRMLLADIQDRARQLNALGCLVDFLWIGGHNGVEGNERADRAARYGADQALARLRAASAR